MFAFNEGENLAVIACKCVMQESNPILRVTRDEDGDWQFLCGGSHTAEDAMLVSLRQVYDRDNTVAGAAGLPAGRSAVRDSAGGSWQMPD